MTGTDGEPGYGEGTGEDEAGWDAREWQGEADGPDDFDDADDFDGAVAEDDGLGLDDDVAPDDAVAPDEGEGADVEYGGDGGYDQEEGYGQAGPLPPAHHGLSRRGRRALSALGVFVVVVLLVGAIGYTRISHDINPGGNEGSKVTVSIPKGASTAAIAHLLAKAGVLHGADVFEVYVKLNGAGPLYPGTYRLATNERYSAVVAQLELGPPVLTRKLVVPEGFTVAKMAAAVARLKGIGISEAQFEAAARAGQVGSAYLPAGEKNLEGLLFPATYPVEQGETADELVQYMASTFTQEAKAQGLLPGHPVAVTSPYSGKKTLYTPYQVVIVASIVEREAKLASDRGPIASAIYNRLANGMTIGAESTLLYGLGDPKGKIDNDTPNPYNTLLNHGLPPTPIASPGLPSLEAAMHPPQTSYLYWVTVHPDGKMGYASTNAGFKRLAAECRAAKLC